MKVQHVLPMAAGAWLIGTFVPIFFLATMCTCCADREFPLGYALPTLLLVSCIALVLGRSDKENLRPIHIVLGFATASAIAFAVFVIFGGLPLYSGSDAAPLICWLHVVTPASGVLGMIRGVRGRSTPEPLSSLFWCMVLITACCLSAWWLSSVFIPRANALTVPYTPPQLGVRNHAEPADPSSRHTHIPAR